MSDDGRLLIDGELQDPTSVDLRDFTAFYETVAPRVTWAIRSTIGRRHIQGGGAEDIAQRTWETVAKNWQRIGRFASPENYTCAVAASYARKALAAGNADLIGDALYTDGARHHPHVPGPEAHLELRWLWDIIKKSLAPRQVQVLALALDGYPDKDIATVLDITTDSVRSHRRHAKDRLARRLHTSNPDPKQD